MSDCLFCKIVEKQIPAKLEYEDDRVLVFHDINPQAPTHLLIIPKKHIAQVNHMSEKDSELLGSVVYRAQEVAKQKGLEDFRLVFNNGAEAGQTVFHIHLHLLSGRKMTWPPG